MGISASSLARACKPNAVDRSRDKYRGLKLEQFEQRVLFAISPTLVAIQPNEGDILLDGQTRNIAPQQLTLRFGNGSAPGTPTLDAATIPSSIQIVRAGGDDVFGNGNDVPVTQLYVGPGDQANEAIVRFASILPDDLYRITIVGSGANALKTVDGGVFNDGANLSRTFNLDLGAQILGVVPQPITRVNDKLQQDFNSIVVYFNQPMKSSDANNPSIYQLINTKDTDTTADDTVKSPTSAQYDPVAKSVRLTFDSIPVGTYRLRLGDSNFSLSGTPLTVTPGSDPGSSLITALDPTNGGNFPASGIILKSSISSAASATNTPYNLTLPGSMDDPGHRDIPAEQHLFGGADSDPGIATYAYNFKRDYGSDPQGNPLTNQITETQKQRAREIFEIYGKYLGVKFVETPDQGLTIATGDLRAVAPSVPTGPGGVAGIAGGNLAVMDNAENWGNSEFGGGWFTTAFHEIGHLLGLGHDYDLPAGTVMGGGETLGNAPSAEPVFPGDADIIHGQFLYRPDGKDVDFYRVKLPAAGRFSAETIAQRLTSNQASAPSLLDSVISLYDANGQLVARNDDYFGKDAFVDLDLNAGVYYIAVSSTGNTAFNPLIADSGLGGTTEGQYQLRLNFAPAPSGTVLRNATGAAFDGDQDGQPGGAFNFWFRAGDSSNTIYVDKQRLLPGQVDANVGNGSIATPYSNLGTALQAANALQQANPNVHYIVRVAGNNGVDNAADTLGDNRAYQIGYDTFNQPLQDGATLNVPKDVTLMIDAGAILKLRRANVNVGSFSQGIDQSGGAIQVLGTPTRKVIFTSAQNDVVGTRSDNLPSTPTPGDWGGLVFRSDSDHESSGIFLNYVNNADISYGGGAVAVDSIPQSYDPIHLIGSRPTIANNVLLANSGAVVSADPNSFEETLFRSETYTADYRRAGPVVHGNQFTYDPSVNSLHPEAVNNALPANSINGLFIRIRTEAGVPLDVLDVSARLTATDIAYVLTDALKIQDKPGGPELLASGGWDPRASGRLAIDPGALVKLQGGRIETGVGGQLIAEGTAGRSVVFTSLFDDRYGAGGALDTTGDGAATSPAPGDWGGVYLGPTSKASFDHVVLSFAGGVNPIEGGFGRFNAIEARQADLRIANSVLQDNADGAANDNRNGRAATGAATVFVMGAQPIIVDNVFRNNAGNAVSINANAMSAVQLPDSGRSTGAIDRFTTFDDNDGPLVRLNRLQGNGANGMEVRGATLTTETVWDDTDIVHVLRDEIVVPNLHTYGGLTLKSSPTASLVIKAKGDSAGFTASGSPLDINDRIGGSLQVLGMPGHPVVMTSLADDTVGAGFNLVGEPQTDTNGDGNFTSDLLPTVPQTPNGNVIDNNVPAGTPGQFAFDVRNGGRSGYFDPDDPDLQFNGAGISAQGTNQLFNNEDVIFEYINYLDVGANGGAIDLSKTTITKPATLVGPDHVVSEGDIDGNNGAKIHWKVDSLMLPGDPTVYNTITLTSTQALGTVRFINYLDEDILNPNDDLLRLTGAPGENDFSAFTLDGEERVGFSQGGVFKAGAGLVNATYAGFAADQYDDLGQIIEDTGTTYSVAGNINASTLPAFNDPQLGAVRGLNDVTTAFAWDVDPTKTSATITTTLHLVARNPASTPLPGDWRGVKLDQYSNDRNVAAANESEPAYLGPTSVNNSVQSAQFLGTLAPDQKNGDETRRLGFEVHGNVAYDNPGDVDVYSFKATAGTQVWFDIDRTSSALDTVLELVNADGAVIARSDNSIAESGNPSLLFAGSGMQGKVNPLQLGDFSASGNDLYTTNPKDSGFRAILPAGSGDTYFIRVRSNNNGNLADPATLSQGKTSGRYQLQIRLQETDEFPGSTVQFADIRDAAVGIDVQGLPAHSPLTGDSTNNVAGSPLPASIANVTLNTAQDLGNLLASDRNTIALSSYLNTPGDVDWFKFTLDYQDIQAIGGFSDSDKTWSTIFDVSYADGLSRPDTTISVFDALGNLIYVGRDSNISDKQPLPTGNQTAADLSRGSFGKLDPYIGSVQLPEGTSKTYYVAVSSNGALPQQLNATFRSDALNKLVRLEPVNSVKRVVEDHIGFTSYATADMSGAAQGLDPILPVGNLSTGTTLQDAIQLQTNVRPFKLSDVALFVSQSFSGHNLSTVDPYTGVVETTVGPLELAGDRVQDIVVRSDGMIMGTTTSFDDANGGPDNKAGHLVQIDPNDARVYDIGPDNIPDVPNPRPVDPTQIDPDMVTSNSVDALTYQRFDPVNTADNVVEHYNLFYSVRDQFNGQSVLYAANPVDGTANLQQDIGVEPLGNIYQTTRGDVGFTTGMAFVRTAGLSLSAPSGSQIIDGQFFSIGDAEKTVTFEFDNNGIVANGRVAVSFTSAMTFDQVVDSIDAAIQSSGLNVVTQQAGSGGVIFAGELLVSGAFSSSPGNSQVEFFSLPNGGDQLYGVSSSGKFYSITYGFPFYGDDASTLDVPGQLAHVIKDFGPSVPFAGLAIGPQNLDLNGDGVGGDLSTTLFAITTNGDLYAIDPLTGDFRMDVFKSANGTPVNHVSTGLQDVTGLGFSPLDFNLWHPTTQQATDPGHGILPAPDHSRDSLPTEQLVGGASYYFGLENTGGGYISYPQAGPYGVRKEDTQYGILNASQQLDLTFYSAQNYLNDLPTGMAKFPALIQSVGMGNNYNLPAGAHGSLETNSFSLAGYDATDKPTLYFNYFLETENASGKTMKDAARVFVSQDNGVTWDEVATNNSALDTELPKYITTSSNVASSDGITKQQVQPLWNTVGTVDPQSNAKTLDNKWRQARVDLGKYAGQSNLMLRFDFSTSGQITDPSNPNYTGPLPGDQFGNLKSNAAGKNNNFKGFYIDDIVVGFAERGEMVTQIPLPGANPDDPPPAPNTDFFPVPTNPSPGSVSQVLQGAYQLEIRRGTEYASNVSGINSRIAIGPGALIDTNDRLVEGYTLVAPTGSAIANGQTFTLGDGKYQKTFEFRSSGSPSAGNIAINYAPTDSAPQLAKRIRDAVNSQYGPNFQISAASIVTSPRVDLYGVRKLVASGTPALGAIQFDALGDQNVPREQGALIIQNNVVSNSQSVGIRVAAAARDSNGSHPGAIRNLRELNVADITTGAVVANNIVNGFGQTGIQFSGDPNTPLPTADVSGGTALVPRAPIPYGRILNNTVYNSGKGVGITVSHNAGPTLLNNILAGLQTGIAVDPTSAQTTVLGANLYQVAGQAATGVSPGSFALVLNPTDPLFVNAAGGNFRLAKGSKAIDSSLNSLQDRASITTVTAPLGIGPSSILAPAIDVYGNARVDDPLAATPPGLGANIFIDRGATDRTDFDGPRATLTTPQDNDPAGLDLDQDPTHPNKVVFTGSEPLFFAVQISDAGGVGIDQSTVKPEYFHLFRDGVELTRASDYVFGFDATNNVVRFTPFEGLWRSGHVYQIKIDRVSIANNGAQTPLVADLNGNPLQPNQSSATGPTDPNPVTYTIDVRRVDLGSAPDPSYPTLVSSNGARHMVVLGTQLGAQNNLDDGVNIEDVTLQPGVVSTITVNASAAGKLNAWIDWNGDGDWNDAGETVFNNQSLVAGNNSLQVSVPATAITSTYARFRFSTAGNLAPTGLAPDGEVEDYRIVIAPSVKYTVELVMLRNGVETAVPKDAQGNYVVLPGVDVRAKVYATDTRTLASPATGGVFSAFASLSYDPDGLDFKDGTLKHSAAFDEAKSGTIDEPGQILDEAGGTVKGTTPTGANAKLLVYTVDAHIKDNAALGSVFNLALNPANSSPARSTLVFGVNGPVAATYVGVGVKINEKPWTNPLVLTINGATADNSGIAYGARDVSGDGMVSPSDALRVINYINAGLGPNPPAPGNFPPPYYDVNGDGRVSPADVLAIFNFLNDPVLSKFPTGQSAARAAALPTAQPAATTTELATSLAATSSPTLASVATTSSPVVAAAKSGTAVDAALTVATSAPATVTVKTSSAAIDAALTDTSLAAAAALPVATSSDASLAVNAAAQLFAAYGNGSDNLALDDVLFGYGSLKSQKKRLSV